MFQRETSDVQFRTVDRFNREKLYIQLTRLFIDEVKSGRWALGERIPSEIELCNKYQVSKITVRQAVNNLVSDGYLAKLQGKGTFVTGTAPVVGLAMRTSFSEDMFGEAVTTNKVLLARGIVEPSAQIRDYLKSAGAIYRFLCRRMVDGKPAYIDASYVPYHMLVDIETVDILSQSMYSVLQESARLKVFKMIQTVEIVDVDEESSAYLEIEKGVPALAVHRLLLSSDNTPVGYTRFVGRSDRYKFQTEFERIR